MNHKKIWVLLSVVAVVIAFIIVFQRLGWQRYFNLQYVQANLQRIRDFVASYGYWAYGLYFLLYFLAVAAFLPVALWLTLLAGALFPLWVGVIIVSFASAFGATANAFFARYLLRGSLEKRYQRQLKQINYNLEKNGSSYLFTLRLLPIFPFFVINLVFGLTRMKLWVFHWVSQVGTLAGSIVYVNAGHNLAQIKQLSDIRSPQVLISFILLATLPYIAKLLVAMIKHFKFVRRFPPPKSFDANVVVIGAGAGGLISAYIANMLKAKVVLVERSKMGGDCLNYGCVPSKSILTAAKSAVAHKHAAEMGVHYEAPQVDFSKVMRYVHDKIATIAPNDSVERYNEMGIQVLQGEAKLRSPYEVEVGSEVVRTRSIILATGGAPRVPNWPGLREVSPLTSETIWQLREQPSHLLVFGGGPIGAELALAFACLGTKVTMVERGPQLLSREEPEAARIAQDTLQKHGVQLLLNAQVSRFYRSGEAGGLVEVELQQKVATGEVEKRVLQGDQVLLALGRVPNSATSGLAEMGVEINERGAVETDEYLRTSIPNIFAVGDVTVPMQFTHVAGFSAYFAAVNALFGRFKKSRMSLHAVPMVTYLDPEIARVGLTEVEARKIYDEDVEVCRYSLEENDRAIAEGRTEGFVCLVLQKSKGSVLGVTIVAPHAGEMLGEWTMVLNHKVKKEAIFASIYSYPTYSEANKGVISELKKRHMPVKALVYLERFFRMARRAKRNRSE